jgi:hypothetical protein
MKTALIFLTFAGTFFGMSSQSAVQNLVLAWFPSQPGDTWIYRREERNGSEGGGVTHPEIGSWREEQTIVNAISVPEGILLLKRIHAVDPVPGNVVRHSASLKGAQESYLLLRESCVYGSSWEPIARNNQLLPKFRYDLIRGAVPAEFCFPLTQGMTWGQVPGIPAVDDFWRVIGINADPYGLPGATTFHFSAREGSGTMIDRWFAQGVGVLQQITEHHGTYEESRLQLLQTTIHGQTRTYQLTPAFANQDACDKYASTLR